MNSNTKGLDPGVVAARLPVVPLAVLLSCAFSVLVILQNPLLNDDAYKYLRAADVFNADGARAVLESFGWFHYSILIALLDRVLFGDTVIAAHVLNTALYALLTYAFISLTKELRDTPRTQLFAALCILAFPLTNEMRYFLIRDTGFWALALLSLVYLIRFNRSGDVAMAARWSAALIAASVFRLEGLLLMALAPWCLLLPDAALPMRERAIRCGRLVAILVALAMSVFVIALIAGFSLPELVAYAYRWYLPLLGNLSELLVGTAGGVGSALFTPDNFPGSDNTAVNLVIALFGYALALVLNLAYALSPLLAILLIGYRLGFGPLDFPKQAQRALHTYVVVAALALLLFIVIMHFLTQRYAALLALLVLVYVPPVFDALYARAQAANTLRRFHAWCFFLVLFYAVDSLVSFGYSQQHVDAGSAWARGELPAGAPLKTNNFTIAYRSGRIPDYDQTQRDAEGIVAASTRGDYLALEIDRDAPTAFLDTHPALTEVTRFENERGDQVRIYLHR